MATGATDVDYMAREAMGSPSKMQKFVSDPDGFVKLMHYTPHDEIDVYDAIDVTKQSELRQEGKVAIVTGAGRGIGRATAIEFAKAGAKGIAIAARTVSQLEEVKGEINKISPKTEVHLQQVDVGDEAAVKSLYDNVKGKFGAVDVVVSNAGAQTEYGKMIPDTDTDSWWNDYVVNVKGTYLMAKYFAKTLDGKEGTFISINSGNGIMTSPSQSSYCTNKAASIRVVEQLHLEVPNLRSFNVHPGVVETQMVKDAADKMGIKMNLNWTSPALTGAVSLFLATPRAEFLRGRFVSVNWRMDELEDIKEKIVEHHLLKSAFNAKFGV